MAGLLAISLQIPEEGPRVVILGTRDLDIIRPEIDDMKSKYADSPPSEQRPEVQCSTGSVGQSGRAAGFPNGPEIHSASYKIEYRVFPGVKGGQSVVAITPPHSSAEALESMGLYLHAPKCLHAVALCLEDYTTRDSRDVCLSNGYNLLYISKNAKLLDLVHRCGVTACLAVKRASPGSNSGWDNLTGFGFFGVFPQPIKSKCRVNDLLLQDLSVVVTWADRPSEMTPRLAFAEHKVAAAAAVSLASRHGTQEYSIISRERIIMC
ncbi:hypothetical protein ANN_21280 [Periplaneta americana]|uniref:Uncharacterized protein n=1 Tax=Periplaneta americana TaxID=6978 RepID=A0ABQ8SEW2_PERAM|nr:hypothetical protein ANN_21280 [Periplaneta americana]